MAEAQAELGQDAEARANLLKVMHRADATASIPADAQSGDALVELVLLERRKESLGEGFRWNDIKRRSLPFSRTGDHWSKWDFTVDDVDYYRLTFPIPQYEIDANEVLSEADQNPGY